MRRQQTRFERLMIIRQMNTENVINILRSKNLLLSYLECEACMLPMVERSRKVLGGVCWVCTNANCYKFRTTKSIRTNSFFDKFRISLSDIFSVVIDEVHKKPSEIFCFYCLGRCVWTWSNKNVIGCAKKKCRRKALLFRKPPFYDAK